MLDTNIFEKPKDYATVAGEPMTVDVPDDVTVVFNLPAPKPGLLAHFATHFAQGFQPKHFSPHVVADDAVGAVHFVGGANHTDAPLD